MGNEVSATGNRPTRTHTADDKKCVTKMATLQSTEQYYRVEVSKTAWELPVRYQEITPIGTGAYGTVW